MLKTLLVEDDLDLATTLIDYMALEDIECDYAADGLVGYNLSLKGNYDVIILDLNLPKLEGLTVCERLRSQEVETPILMLTACDTLEDKLIGFSKGADDYLVKPFAMEELIARIKVLSKRRSGQMVRLTVADLHLDLSMRKATRAGVELKLSPTSLKLLELLMRASPASVSREKLAQGIWGDEQPDSNSLKVHIFNLRKQVDQPGWPQLLHTIPGFGFSLYEKEQQ